MTTYQFTCPGCTQEIEVDNPMRETILQVGCPVCTETIDEAAFDRL